MVPHIESSVTHFLVCPETPALCLRTERIYLCSFAVGWEVALSTWNKRGHKEWTKQWVRYHFKVLLSPSITMSEPRLQHTVMWWPNPSIHHRGREPHKFWGFREVKFGYPWDPHREGEWMGHSSQQVSCLVGKRCFYDFFLSSQVSGST